MSDFEDQLDLIRIKLYDETKGMDKEEIVENVNSHAKKIAQQFGIKIEKSTTNEKYFQAMTT
jgi:hypothetical protein